MRPVDRLSLIENRQPPLTRRKPSPEICTPRSSSPDSIGLSRLPSAAVEPMPSSPCRPSAALPRHKRILPFQADMRQVGPLKRYRSHDQQPQATEFGLNPEQVQTISQRGVSLGCVQALIKWSPKLQRYGFTYGEMTTLGLVGNAHDVQVVAQNIAELRALDLSAADILEAVRCKGARSIESMVSYGRPMRNFGFTATDLVRITKRSGGKETIEFVTNYIKEFRKLGLTNADIMKVAKKAGARPSLRALITHRDLLNSMKLPKDEIIKIAASGGVQVIEALNSCKQALRKLDVKSSDILSIATQGGGAQAIRAMLEKKKALNELGFSDTNIVRMARHIGGARTLDAIVVHAGDLRDLELTNEDIMTLANHDGASRAFAAIVQHKEALQKMGLQHEDIIGVAANSGGAQCIDAVVAHEVDFKKLRISTAEMIEIAKKQGAAQAIKAVVAHAAFLIARGFRPADLVKLAVKHGGSVLITAVASHEKDSEKFDLRPSALMQVATRQGGAQAIRAIIEYGKDLKKLNYTEDEVVALACAKGGADAIEKIAASKESRKRTTSLSESMIERTTRDQAGPFMLSTAHSEPVHIPSASATGGAVEVTFADVVDEQQLYQFYVDLGFSLKDTYQMAAKMNDISVWVSVRRCIKKVRSRTVRVEDIKRLADEHGSSPVFSFVSVERPLLEDLGFSPTEMLQLIVVLLVQNKRRLSGLSSTLTKYKQSFIAFGLQSRDLVKIAASAHGERALAIIGSQSSVLSDTGFSRAPLSDISVRKEGPEMLSLAVEFAAVFQDATLTPVQFAQHAVGARMTSAKLRQLMTTLCKVHHLDTIPPADVDMFEQV